MGHWVCERCNGLGSRCPDCGFGMRQWSGQTDDAIARQSLLRDVRRLAAEVDRLAALPGTFGAKAKRGVEIHGQLERLMTRLRSAEAMTDGVSPILAEARKVLHATTERVLIEVFELDPSQVKKVTKRKGGTVPPTTRLPVDSISGVSLAATKTFVNDEFASVEVRLNNIKVEGIAKRDPADKPNQDIGLSLATGRALRKLGGQIINEANRAVAAADKEQRREQARKAQARAEQRKGERKVQAERTAVEEAAELRRQLAAVRQDQTRSIQTIEELSDTVAGYERREAERKARDYKQRIAKRKANAAAKKAPVRRKVKA